jgi:putative ATPase
LDEVVGQEHLTDRDAILTRAIETGQIPSIIFWGPPGSGKTTLARLLSQARGYRWAAFSAVLSGIAEIRGVVKLARHAHEMRGVRTLLFVDEIHRFNKAQQDAFLPHVEEGRIVLLGATTENPSFEVNSALLSRVHVLLVKRLETSHLGALMDRALSDEERGIGSSRLELDPEMRAAVVTLSDGDARQLYNIVEILAETVRPEADGLRVVTQEHLRKLRERVILRGDKSGEEHFNLISALQKSIRGSDPDASLYWLARLLEAGEDPLFVARRLVRIASEDIGLADPNALVQAMAARDAVHFIGQPEGALALAQATVYMAMAQQDVQSFGSLPVPLHLSNAPTRMMEKMGYGKGYQYPHSYPGAWVKERYRPDQVQGRRYYEPSTLGAEPRLWARYVERVREALRLQKGGGGGEEPRGEGSPGESQPS